MASVAATLTSRPLTVKEDKEDQLALHLFCQHQKASVEECQALLAANPAAARKRDVYGRMPLFYALKQPCSEDVIRLVFEAHPDAVMERDWCGVTPLYLVYHASMPCSTLKSMLEYSPNLALKRINSFSAPDLVRLVCAPWEAMIGKTAEEVRNDTELSNQWNKVVLTIRAAHEYRHKHQPLHGLHAAISLPCSPKILSWFIQMYPHQLRIPMNDEKLPLHVFVTSRAFCNRQGADGILQRLLELYPEAASIPWKGQLPLHLAIQCGCTWTLGGLQRLLYAYPLARQIVDVESNLYPFMMMHSDPSTRYCLLREGPEVLIS